MRRILVVNGPNLDLLGRREPEVYGTSTLDELNGKLAEMAKELDIKVEFFQSNSDGEIIDYLHREGLNADGLIINPGALTHYSYALRDAITAANIETVEVHLSNIYSREEFRRRSVIAPVCKGQLVGFGFYGYAMALSFFVDTLRED